MIDGIVNDKDFQKSDTGIETYDSIKKIKYPQEYEDGCFIIKDNLNENEKNDPRVQALVKRSRHSNLSVLIICQDYF